MENEIRVLILDEINNEKMKLFGNIENHENISIEAIIDINTLKFTVAVSLIKGYNPDVIILGESINHSSAKPIYSLFNVERKYKIILIQEQKSTSLCFIDKVYSTHDIDLMINELSNIKPKIIEEAKTEIEAKIENLAPINLIAIGASAGGTIAISELITGFEADMPPVVIVQHIPADFVDSFADRLDAKCKMHVSIAHHGEELKNGHIYLAGGNSHLRVTKGPHGYIAMLSNEDRFRGHKPSIDLMFYSVAECAKENAIGVILTGMGKDGAEGLKKMRDNGAYTIGQDEESSVVYGMPHEAYTLGAVCTQQPLSKIAEVIKKRIRR